MAVLVGRVNKPRMAKVGEGSKTARRRLEREQLSNYLYWYIPLSGPWYSLIVDFIIGQTAFAYNQTYQENRCCTYNYKYLMTGPEGNS